MRDHRHSSTLAASVRPLLGAFAIFAVLSTPRAFAADPINGRVVGAGAPIVGSTVTLWGASAGPPRQLAETRTDADGRFNLTADTSIAMLYLTAKGGQPVAAKTGGDNPAITMLAVIGSKPPANVVINEMTTLASVITHTQFIDGTSIKGSPLALRIAAGNVPNFVDLSAGDYGATILDPLNSAQTPTMANFATLANILAACVAQLKSDACDSLFRAAVSPTGTFPEDTLAATEFIVRYPWHQPDKVFAVFNDLYPQPKDQPGKLFRPTPFLPYLTFAPSAWVFPLRFTGGGLSAPGKLMFDSEGNAWVANNWTVGAQNLDATWTGGLSKFAPNGRPLSPSPLGFRGGGLGGPGFGLTLDAHEHVWVTSWSGRTISLFDKTGKPLSPPDGWNFDGKLNTMQGIIAMPNGDIWAADLGNSQILRLPNGDPSRVEFLCQNKASDPLDNPCKLLAPFAMAVDHQNRIWISNLGSDTATRIDGSDPSKVENFKIGYSGSGLAVDSLGNVWITNKLGSSERGHLKLLEILAAGKIDYNGQADPVERMAHVLVPAITSQQPGYDTGGSISVLRPDGSEASFSPVYGKGIATPWAISIDGNDNIWITNFSSPAAGIVELCGFHTENCPPGVKTGDAISPPGGYVGGGMQYQVDAGIGPAGDVWITNNWQDWKAVFPGYPEALSTLGAGQGLVVFYGMAKPIQTPLIGPARAVTDESSVVGDSPR
jgi:streptogramin lyase